MTRWKRCIRCRGAGSLSRGGGYVVCPYCRGEGEVRVYASGPEERAPTDGRAGQQRKRTTDQRDGGPARQRGGPGAPQRQAKPTL